MVRNQGRWRRGAPLVFLLVTTACVACGRAPKRLAGPAVYSTDVTLSSLDCDVVMWRRIFVHDEHDAVIAEADSGPPLGATDGGCTVHFTVALPKAKSYVLDNGTRRCAPFSFDDLKGHQFRMAVRLR